MGDEAAAQDDYLQQLVDQIPAFLWVIDRDLIVRRIEGGRPMLATLDRDRLVGLPMADVTGMGSSAEDIELSVAMHRRVLEGATERYRATWKGITLEARIHPLRDRHGNVAGILGVGIDVTEQTRMEAQLRGSEERFRAVVEGLTDLIAILGDDFRVSYASPSQRTVLGYRAAERDSLDPWSLVHPDDIDYARAQFAALEPDRSVHMSRPIRIRSAAERAANITRQLLAFSRQQVPAADRVDLVEVVHDLTGMLRALLPATIALDVSPDRGAPAVFVIADRGQLDQVIMNLAVNARDAMPNGGSLSITVRTATTADGAHSAVLDVHDNGAGMSREVQAHVFEPFFTTKGPGRGTGLGLSTVYGIVRHHSGSIEIASAVGQGTTVTVRLPMAAPGAEPVTNEPERVEVDDRGRVLVVEDETQVREVAERFLRRAGYDVLTASDAATALASLASNGPFDLVLTDSAMPGMRGEDLATEIRHIQPGLPVILMSGYADSARPESSAVAAFIQKPFTIPALLAEVRRVLARDRPPSERS